MKRRALGLLLAAAALPAAPLFAQDTTATQPPPAEASPPPAAEPAPKPEAPASVATAPAPAPEATAPAPAPARRTTTATSRTTHSATRLPVRRAVPVATAPVATVIPAPVTTVTTTTPVVPAPVPAPPVAVAPPVETLPATEPSTVDPAVSAGVAQQDNSRAIWPWLLLGALLVGALALFALRRRGRDTLVRDEVYERRAAVEPVAAPMAAAPIAAAAVAEPLPEPLPIAGADTGRPWLELQMNPVRAGVEGDEAKVEFKLTVANQGSAAARDVRISTFMIPAGQESEMERLLIERGTDSSLPEVTIDAGDGRMIETSVALATDKVAGDSVLPVVVADARYRLPDGSEGRTSASFAVGVPDGDELYHFATDQPSGLHEGVEARQLGEAERV